MRISYSAFRAIILCCFVIFFCMRGFSAPQHAEISLYTDLRDLVKYKSQDFPLIPKIFRYLQECESCRPDNLAFTTEGPNKIPMTRSGVLYGVELISPVNVSSETIKFELQAIGMHSDQKIFYYRGQFVLDANFRKEIKVGWSKHNLTQNTRLEIIVGRWQRKLILKSTQPDFFKVYPIAVGGFSKNYADVQTPRLEGLIRKDHSRFYESREEPWYYFGFPFLGILNQRQNYTMYGLHATLLPAAENFNRGFISTGCIHLQVKDIYEVFALLKYGSPFSTKISIRDALPSEYSSYDSPVPYNNAYHSRVADGSKGEDGLTKMIRIKSSPPSP